MDSARVMVLGVILVMALPAILPWLFVVYRVGRGWKKCYAREALPRWFLVWTVIGVLLAIPMLIYLVSVGLELYMGLTCQSADCAGIGMLTFFVSWPAYLAAFLTLLLYWLFFRRRLLASTNTSSQ